jgi:hypothetical protein
MVAKHGSTLLKGARNYTIVAEYYQSSNKKLPRDFQINAEGDLQK